MAEVLSLGRALPDAERDLPSIRRILDGIAHNIDENLLDPAAVAYDLLVLHIHDVHTEAVIMRLNLRPRHGQHPVDELRQAEFLLLQLHFPGFDLAHIQDFIDQGEQVVGGFRDFPQTVRHPLPVVKMIGGDCGHADNPVHRSAYIVAHAGEEFAFGLIGGIGCVDGLAQRLLDLLFLPRLVVHVLESGDDIGRTAFKNHFGKLQTVVADSVFEHPPERNRIDQLILRVFYDVFRQDRIKKILPVFFKDQV